MVDLSYYFFKPKYKITPIILFKYPRESLSLLFHRESQLSHIFIPIANIPYYFFFNHYYTPGAIGFSSPTAPAASWDVERRNPPAASPRETAGVTVVADARFATFKGMELRWELYEFYMGLYNIW